MFLVGSIPKLRLEEVFLVPTDSEYVLCILSAGTRCGKVRDRIVVALASWQVLPPPTASVPEYCGTAGSGAVLRYQWETR